MKLVVIESPLAAPSPEGRESNKMYARACMRDSLRRGEAPYASHLLFDQRGLLDDAEEEERKMGMEAGFAWGRAADLVAVYTDRGISSGMEAGLRQARARGTPIVYRTLKTEEEAPAK